MTKQDPAANEMPLFKDDVREVAEKHDMDFFGLAKAVSKIHHSLYEDADELVQFYQDEFDDPVIVDVGHFVVMYVNTEEWDVIEDRSELPVDVVRAAQEAYNRTALRMGADQNVLAGNDALLVPHPNVAKLMRAGLSQKQAEVQALRMDGATHETISDELSMAVGTVKSHCQRIDEKVRKAERLTELVDDDA